MPRNVKTLSVSLNYKTPNARAMSVPFVSRSCFSKDDTGTPQDQAQGLHTVPTQEAKFQATLVKVHKTAAITTRCLINKRTWILINTKIAIVMTYLTKNAIVKRYLINKRTWILNNTKTNIVKKSRTPKRSYTINNIKIVIDKRYQFTMLTWIPNTTMTIIDIIVMTYLSTSSPPSAIGRQSC